MLQEPLKVPILEELIAQIVLGLDEEILYSPRLVLDQLLLPLTVGGDLRCPKSGIFRSNTPLKMMILTKKLI